MERDDYQIQGEREGEGCALLIALAVAAVVLFMEIGGKP